MGPRKRAARALQGLLTTTGHARHSAWHLDTEWGVSRQALRRDIGPFPGKVNEVAHRQENAVPERPRSQDGDPRIFPTPSSRRPWQLAPYPICWNLRWTRYLQVTVIETLQVHCLNAWE